MPIAIASNTSRDRPGIAGRYLMPGAALAVLFSELLLFGAEQPALSLLAATVELLLLALMLISVRSCRLPAVSLIIAFFGIIGIGVLQLMPIAGLGHPASSYVGQAGIVSLDPWASRVEVVKLLGLGALFVYAMQLGRNDTWRPFFFHALIIGGLLYGLWAFLDRILSPETFLGLSRGLFADRLTGSFLSANTAATFFGICTILAVCGGAQATARMSGARRADKIAKLAPPAALFLVSATCLLQTASRAGAAATLAALFLVVAIITWSRTAKSRALGALVAVALAWLGASIAIYLVSGERLTDRIGMVENDLLVRQKLYQAYWRAFQDAPLFGYGLGSFHQVNALVTPPTSPTDFAYVGSAHNVYLQWLMEGGAIGFAFMVLVIGMICLGCARAFVTSRSARPYVLAAFGALLILCLHGMTDFAFQIPALSTTVTVLLGLAYGHPAARR